MSEIQTPITGGCLCGAIRYELSEPPVEAVICHCRTCQKSTGSAFEVGAMFFQSAFRLTRGEPKLYRSSSIMDKGFCSNCCTLLFDKYLVRVPGFDPDTVYVQVGTLDHPEAVSIEFHYGVESQLPWVHFDDDLPRMRCDEDPELAVAFEAAEAGEE